MKKLLATALLGTALATTPAFADTTFAGSLGASGTADYRFYFAGGSFSVGVDSAGDNPIGDPSIYIFGDNGSPLTAKTGTQFYYNDDYNGLNSYISGNLEAGNYILSVGRYYFDASTARSANAGGYAAGTTFNVTFGTGAVVGSVPEPATWGMMILGFGLMGAALRSRQTKVAFAA